MINKKTISIVAAALIIIIAHYAGILNNIETLILDALKPIERVVFKSGNKITTIYTAETDKRDLYKINKALEEQNRQLLTENVMLKNVVEENNTLRQQLDFFSKHEYKQLLSNVINRGNNLDSGQSITIDRGSRDGLQIGQAIIAKEGVIVGKIFAVKDNIAHVCLITDESCKVAAAISGKEGTDGLTSGKLGLTVEMNFVPQTESIVINDTIITSGLEELIPRGLLIGTIQEIYQERDDLFQTAVINPFINLNNLSIVSIIIK